MTKNEFIKDYCERSEISDGYFHKYRVALPCACQKDGCQGWAAIRLDSYIIEDHLTFDAPLEIRRFFNA